MACGWPWLQLESHIAAREMVQYGEILKPLFSAMESVITDVNSTDRLLKVVLPPPCLRVIDRVWDQL